MSDQKPKTQDDIIRKKAVRWLSPKELMSAGFRVGLSTTFGEYADKREMVGMIPQGIFDYSKTPQSDTDELWVDFVSDTGDGFAATYAVASKLGQEDLKVTDDNNQTTSLPRGQLLIHGGDLVYPTATEAEYKARFTGPYEASLPHTYEDHPHFFAIPGNHDWYDGLNSFLRRFCERTWLGGRIMPQERSYFAIKLTANWWIWGIDIQFDGSIDKAQIEYFKAAGHHFQDDPAIILASAKPSWAYVHPGDKTVPTPEMKNLDYFMKECTRARTDVVFDPATETQTDIRVPEANVRMMLSGDIHHYARYADETNDVQYLTAGGGGAYLSLTHHLEETITLRKKSKSFIQGVDERTLKLQKNAIYPRQEWSRSKRYGAVLAGFRNPSFAGLLGSIYLVLAVLALRSLPTESGGFTQSIEAFSDERFLSALTKISGAGMTSPGNIVMFAVFTWILTKYTRSKDRVKAALYGGSHALAHIAGLAFTVTLLSRLTPEGHPIISWAIYMTGLFLLGSVFGSIIFGLYLVIADKLHPNDGYTAQRIEHQKNFLRMKVTSEQVKVWGIGLDYVPPQKAWRPTVNPGSLETPHLTLDKSKLAKGKDFDHHQIECFEISRNPHETGTDSRLLNQIQQVTAIR